MHVPAVCMTAAEDETIVNHGFSVNHVFEKRYVFSVAVHLPMPARDDM